MIMTKLERITITMPEKMAAKMRAAVESGEYATTSEIIREAVRDWTDLQDQKEAAVAKVRAVLDNARKEPVYPAEQVFAELRQLVAEEARKYSAQTE